MSRRMEEVVLAEIPQTGLCPKVDFCTASAYRCPGIPTELFTRVLWVSRMANWTAHVLGQYPGNRQTGPDSEDVVERGLNWVPLAVR